MTALPRHWWARFAWVGLLIGLLVLAACPPKPARERRKRTIRTHSSQPRHKTPPPKRHGSHEHSHGSHPHASGDHHHHPHPHPHMTGPGGHHHPY